MRSSNPEVVVRAFVSLGPDTAKLHEFVRWPCIRNFFDPVISKGGVGEEHEDWIVNNIDDAGVFIGIYGTEDETPKKWLSLGDSQEISRLEFEVRKAAELLGRENVLIFLHDESNLDRFKSTVNEVLRKPAISTYVGSRDLVLALEEALKAWRDRTSKVVNNRRRISLAIEMQDRFGILAAVSRNIFMSGGNIIRAEQRTQLHRAYLFLVAEWGEGWPIEVESLGMALQQELTALFKGDVAVKAVELHGSESLVRARGVFQILYYDGPGVGERIFAVFSQENMSILESSIKVLNEGPPAVGSARIVVDATNVGIELESMLVNRLQGQPGVFLVERQREFGIWWY